MTVPLVRCVSLGLLSGGFLARLSYVKLTSDPLFSRGPLRFRNARRQGTAKEAAPIHPRLAGRDEAVWLGVSDLFPDAPLDDRIEQALQEWNRFESEASNG